MPEPRVKVSVGLTLPFGPYASRRIELEIERDEATDTLSAIHSIRLDLEKELEDFKTQFKTAADIPTQTTTPAVMMTAPPAEPEKPAAAQPQPMTFISAVDELISNELDKLPWKENSTGVGWHMRWDDLPAPLKPKLATKFIEASSPRGYLLLGMYNYRRFGDDNSMLSRYVARPKALEAKQQ